MPMNVMVRGIGGAPPPAPPPATSGTFYLNDTGVGLPLLQGNQPATTQSKSITVTAGQVSYQLTDGRNAAFTGYPGVTGTLHGSYVATIKVTATFAAANMRISVEKSGAFVGGGWGAWQPISSTGTYTFTITDTASPAWVASDSLQLFIEVQNTGATTGTVTWEIGSATETLTTPLVVPITPPPPSGNILFDGRATLMTVLYAYEDVYGDKTTYHHDQQPAIWDGITFLFSDVGRGIALFPDSRYGQVFKCVCQIGDSSAFQPPGAFLTERKGACQITDRRSNNLGQTEFFAIGVKVPSWSGATSSLSWFDFASMNYQTSSGDQMALRLNYDATSPTGLSFAIQANVGFANNPSGFAVGDAFWNQKFLPLTFGQWHEFVIEVHQATDNTGLVRVYHRVPGGTWSVVFTKLNTPTYLWGTTSYGTFNQNGSNWLTVLDKIGIYYGNYDAGIVETAYETGIVHCSDLATAQATFPA